MSRGDRSYVGYGYGRARGIPGSVTNWMIIQTENVIAKLTKKKDPSIIPVGQNAEKRVVKMDATGSIKVTADPESAARLGANFYKKNVASTLDGPNNVYQHVLSPLLPTDPAEAVYREDVTYVKYMDDGVPVTFSGVQVRSWTTEVKANDFVVDTFELVPQLRSNFGEVAEVAVNAAYTGTVHAFGVPKGTIASDIYLKVTTCPTGNPLDGTTKFKARVGLAGTPGPEITLVAEELLTIYGDSGVDLGPTSENPVKVLFHLGDPSDVFTLNDEWKIPLTRAIDTPSYTSRRRFVAPEESLLAFGASGKTYVIPSYTIKRTKKVTAEFDTRSIAAGSIEDEGDYQLSIEISRKYVDRDFVDDLEAGNDVAVVAQLTGDRIGASAYRESRKLEATMSIDDAGPDGITKPDTLDEKITLTAETFMETLVNTLPAGTV